jgi:hypothetical protein
MRYVLSDEPHISFVNERGGLQSVCGALSLKIAASDVAQLIIDDRHQLIERGTVTLAPIREELRDII